MDPNTDEQNEAIFGPNWRELRRGQTEAMRLYSLKAIERKHNNLAWVVTATLAVVVGACGVKAMRRRH